jgi:FixJ family two-component response regulator
MGRDSAMRSQAPTVFVVDPDASVRQSLESAIRRAGWRPEITASPRGFLARWPLQAPSCLLLDVGASRPDLTGFDLLRRIATDRKDIPVVAMSGEPNIPLAVEAIQAGAVEFLTKPPADDILRAAVGRALGQSQAVLQQEAEVLELRNRLDSLSARERDVMVRVVSGFLNKQVGADLGISEDTVKAHRGKVMRKMGADSLADLVGMALRLRLPRVTIARRTRPSLPWSNGSQRRLVAV